MEPLRLLFLNTRLSIGGPAKVTLALAEELARRGHRIVLASGDPEPGERPDPEVARSTLARVRVERLGRTVRPLGDLRALAGIRSLLRGERPDVLLTTGSKAGALGRLAALGLDPRPRTVHVFHGHVFRGHFSTAKSRVFAALERWLARITDDVVAVCDSVHDDLEGLGFSRHTRLHTAPVGYDLRALLQAGTPTGDLHRELGVDATALLVVCPARICHVKAQDVIVEAVGLARESLDPARFQLAMVGDGEDADRLRGRVAELGIGDRVRFLGYRDDMVPVYRDADVVLLASRSEAIPMCLIEAAAAGRPFIATRVGGVPELHRDGLGRLFPADDPGALAGLLVDLQNGPRPEPVPMELRRDVVARFSPTRWADDMERILSRESR